MTSPEREPSADVPLNQVLESEWAEQPKPSESLRDVVVRLLEWQKEAAELKKRIKLPYPYDQLEQVLNKMKALDAERIDSGFITQFERSWWKLREWLTQEQDEAAKRGGGGEK